MPKIQYWLYLWVILSAYATLNAMQSFEWQRIELPNVYIYPCQNPPCGNRETDVYSMQFPLTKQSWFHEPECGKNTYRSTSNRWISDKILALSGFQFKGLFYRNKMNSAKKYTKPFSDNEFAIFFHQDRCYGGGPEYGWVFREDLDHVFFYICGNCNLKNQQWCQWPGGDCEVIAGDQESVKKALQNPAMYRYWSIKVTSSGNFDIELIDPTTMEYISCTIKKPSWLPNLFNTYGYITVSAQKKSESTRPRTFLHADEVKIWTTFKK